MNKDVILNGFDGTSIFTSSKTAPGDRATLIILHGLHDHGGRYANLTDYFNNKGFSTVCYDMRGYGKSAGLRGYINIFDDYVRDFQMVEKHVTSNTDKPCFLFAHSMGALIASLHILENGNIYQGAIFSGGLFKVNEDLSPLLQKMSGLMSRLFPKLKTMKIDATGLSRDPEVEKRITKDALHYVGGIRARTGAEILKSTAKLERQLERMKFPMLILHGGADPLTKHEASELLFAKSRSSDKTLKVYPDAYHELINEINKDEVLDDIHSWIVDRLPKG